MDKYETIGMEGSGRYSVVYRVRNRETDEILARKNIVFRKVTDGVGVPCSVIREVSILKDLDHENIVRLMDVVATEDQISLVFERLDMDLKKFFKYERLPKKDKPQIINNFLRQILSAVSYFHSCKILHRDLKPQNILVDSNNMILKVADFGLSREIGVPRKRYTAEVATLHYLAPEILLGDLQYSYPMDIWAVGCIFAEMAMGKVLFYTPDKTELDQIDKIFSILGTPNEETWPGYTKLDREKTEIFPPQDLAEEVPNLDQTGLDLLSKMLCLDPIRRITADDALKHPYFKKP